MHKFFFLFILFIHLFLLGGWGGGVGPSMVGSAFESIDGEVKHWVCCREEHASLWHALPPCPQVTDTASVASGEAVFGGSACSDCTLFSPMSTLITIQLGGT